MKHLFKAIFLFIFSLFISCKQNTEAVSLEDKTKIVENLKSIVINENADFYKKDLAAWGKHFLHSESVYWICVEDDVTLRATAWADLNKFVGDWMKENPILESNTALKQDII
jgi:hypothetical protein